MDWKQEQKIIKYLNKINDEIEGVGQHIDFIKDVSRHLRDARFEILQVIGLLKLHNDKENGKEENGKEKTVQHRIEE